MAKYGVRGQGNERYRGTLREGGGSTLQWGRESNSLKVQGRREKKKDEKLLFWNYKSSVDCTGKGDTIHLGTHWLQVWPRHLAHVGSSSTTITLWHSNFYLLISTLQNAQTVRLILRLFFGSAIFKKKKIKGIIFHQVYFLTPWSVAQLYVLKRQHTLSKNKQGSFSGCLSDECEAPGARVPRRWDRCASPKWSVCGCTEARRRGKSQGGAKRVAGRLEYRWVHVTVPVRKADVMSVRWSFVRWTEWMNEASVAATLLVMSLWSDGSKFILKCHAFEPYIEIIERGVYFPLKLSNVSCLWVCVGRQLSSCTKI